jgi:hypothetical protein
MTRGAPLALALGLLGCTLAPPAPPPLIDTPPPVIVEAPAKPDAPVASVLRAYKAAERQEIPAITAANVTADFIRRLHRADRDARGALRRLVQQGSHVTPPVLHHARDRVRALAAVLDDPPGPPEAP